MKSRSIILGLVVLLAAAVAVPTFGQAGKVERLDPVTPVLVPPIRDMHFAPAKPSGFNVEIPIRVVPGGSDRDNGQVFPGTQFAPTGVGAPTPLVNFEGQSDADNAVVVGGQFVPPDTDGSVGPTQYVQWVNLIAEVYDKSGNSILGPFPGNAFFTGLGGPCETTNNGDPMTLYDQKNDRWVVSQFAINNGLQCVAVSLTSDATGSYWAYAFNIQGSNDYPKLGIWLNDTRDVLSATYRNFGGPGGNISLDFQVMDYAAMLSGAAAGSSIFRSGAPFLEGTLPADVDGTAYPTTDAALFGRLNNNGLTYDIYEFDANFPNVSTWNGLVDTAAIGPIDRGVGPVPQPAPGESIADHSQFTMSHMAFRDFGTYNQILATGTVDATGGDVAGKYWAELRSPNTSSTNYSVHQEGVYALNNFGPDLERFMGSIAADKNGNIALGYSASNSVSKPSVRYTGRMAADTLGIMRDEVTALSGGGVQTASNGRWGDYSSMSVDPTDDCTFWFTTEYYANTGGFDFNTRIVSFRFSDCGSTPATPSISQTAGSCGGSVTISGTGFTPNKELALVRSPNTNGFVKGGPLCNSTQFEVGEPIVGGPVFVIANGSGGFSTSLSTVAGACLVEAADISGSCLTSNVVDTN